MKKFVSLAAALLAALIFALPIAASTDRPRPASAETPSPSHLPVPSSSWTLPGRISAFTSSPHDPAGVARPAAPAAGWSTLWLMTNPVNNAQNASVAVDGGGHVHVAFIGLDTGGTVYYGYCGQSCDAAASWSITPIASAGGFGGYPRIDVTPSGRPRIMWFNETVISGVGTYQYATCDAGCTNGANWLVTDLNNNPLGPLNQTRYFALDPQGRPRFLYTDTATNHSGTYYAYCDAGCTQVANWYEVHISTTYLRYDFSLAFDAAGEPRFGFYSYNTVRYEQCTGDCSLTSSWSTRALWPIGGAGSLSFALDPAGHPRLAYYQGSNSPALPNDNQLIYGWCDAADCGAATATWGKQVVGLPANFGLQVDLKVDGQGHPQMAYNIDDVSSSTYGLGYTLCSANCQTSSPTWTAEVVETPGYLDAIMPVSPYTGCTSHWLDDGQNPSLALSGTSPRIAYSAAHYQGCPGNVFSDVDLDRFALRGAGITPSLPPKIWLPALMR